MNCGSLRCGRCGIFALVLSLVLILPASASFAETALHLQYNGSASLVPLSEALITHFTAMSPEEAKEEVWHDTTLENVEYKFYCGDSTLLFANHVLWSRFMQSEAYESMAEKESLVSLPILRDALVFLVNADNPVTNLSTEQIHDIYTGQITNWNQVGGEDCEITPFQNVEKTSSQALFQELLMENDTPNKAPYELVSDCNYIWDHPLPYTNEKDALGFSMFYYVNKAYSSHEMRMLSIDGIPPTFETIASGEYPLRAFCYAIFRDNTTKDSPERKVVEFLLSDEGQQLVTEAGYIPLVYPSNAKSADTAFGIHSQTIGTGGTELRDEEILFPKAYPLWKRINDCTDFTFPEMPSVEEAFRAWHQSCPMDECGIDVYREGNLLHIITDPMERGGLHEYFVFDMQTQKKIELSDLFFDGFDYMDYINGYISKHTADALYLFEYNDYREGSLQELLQKRPFTGYMNDYPSFSVQNGMLLLHVQPDDPYFMHNIGGYRHVILEIPLLPEFCPFGNRRILYRNTYQQVGDFKIVHLEVNAEGDQQLIAVLDQVNESMGGMYDGVDQVARQVSEIVKASGLAPEMGDIAFYTSTLTFDDAILVWLEDASDYSMNVVLPQDVYVIDARLISLQSGKPLSLEPLFEAVSGLVGIQYFEEGVLPYPLFYYMSDMESATSRPLEGFTPVAPVQVQGAWIDSLWETDHYTPVVVLRISDGLNRTVRMIVPVHDWEEADLLLSKCIID